MGIGQSNPYYNQNMTGIPGQNNFPQQNNLRGDLSHNQMSSSNIFQNSQSNGLTQSFGQIDTDYYTSDLFSRLIRLIQTMQILEQTDEYITLQGNCQINCQIKLKDKSLLKDQQPDDQMQYSIEHIVKYLELIQQTPKSNKVILFKNKYTLDKTIEIKFQFNQSNCPFWEITFTTPQELHEIYKYVKMIKDVELIGGMLYNQVSVETLETLNKTIKLSI